MNCSPEVYRVSNCGCNNEKTNCPTTIRCGSTTGTFTVTNDLTVLATLEINPRCSSPCAFIHYAVTATAPTDTSRAFAVRVFRNCANGVRVQVGTALQFEAHDTTSTFNGFVCDCNNNCGQDCFSYTIEAQTLGSGHTITGSAVAAGIFGCQGSC